MILLFLGIIVLLIATLVYLNIKFYKERKNSKLNLYVLKGLIIQSSKTQLEQNEKLKLSEEFEKRMKSNNAVLKRDIFKLNYELFKIVSKNKLP